MAYHQTVRSERVRAASRARMLAAARKLFVRRGYAATTMRDVAEAAKTSIGNLYFYFDNKDDLLSSLLAESRGPVWAWVDEAVASVAPGPIRLAVTTSANLLRLLTTDRDLMRLFVTEGMPPKLTEGSVSVHLTNLRAHFRESLPDLPEPELELSLAAWAGAMRRCAERYVRGELTGDPMVVTEFLVRWNLRGLGVPASEIEVALATAHAMLLTRFPGTPSGKSGPETAIPGVEHRA